MQYIYWERESYIFTTQINFIWKYYIYKCLWWWNYIEFIVRLYMGWSGWASTGIRLSVYQIENVQLTHFFNQKAYLYNQWKHMFLCLIVVQSLLQDNTTKSLNQKDYWEHKKISLWVVFLFKGFGCVILK